MTQPHFLAQPWSEVVIGLVAPIGTNLGLVREALRDRLATFRYEATVIRLSQRLRDFDLGISLAESPERDRLRSYMDAGNRLREVTQRPDVLALCAAADIGRKRQAAAATAPLPGRAWIISSLKRPEEVATLRRIYGEGFFLVGVSASNEKRQTYLTDKGMSKEEAVKLIEVDQKEHEVRFGQRTRDVFQRADLFLDREHDLEGEINRFLDLVFGHPFHTPRRDEHGMFVAYAAALRSGDLSRQVGAALFSKTGELIAVGANDVPAPGGGLYWPGPNDERDWKQGFDWNERARERLVDGIIQALDEKNCLRTSEADARRALNGNEIFDITEYGRAVHAEMDALLAAGRSSVCATDATMYVTTFPCHNCAKHLVAAGVSRVVFIEPYPKSRAVELHGDAIEVGSEAKGESNKLRLEPFIGIGPRRFFDLFSMALSDGDPLRRKKDDAHGDRIDWSPDGAQPRVPLSPLSYLAREKRAAEMLGEVTPSAAPSLEAPTSSTLDGIERQNHGE